MDEIKPIADRVTIQRYDAYTDTVEAKDTPLSKVIHLMVGREVCTRYPMCRGSGKTRSHLTYIVNRVGTKCAIAAKIETMANPPNSAGRIRLSRPGSDISQEKGKTLDWP